MNDSIMNENEEGKEISLQKERARQNAIVKKVVILGLKGSGKSTFLTVLQHALSRKHSPWKVVPQDDTEDVMRRLRDRLFAPKGLYPVPTPASEYGASMCFKVEANAKWMSLIPGASFELRAEDLPGEATKGGLGNFRDFYETKVKGCDAIIFLTDPDEIWKKDDPNKGSFQVFQSILNEIKRHGSENIHIAFCVTKFDTIEGPNSAFDKYGQLEDGEMGIEKEAARILSTSTVDFIKWVFDGPRRPRWFAVSATGYTGEGDKRVRQATIHNISRPDGSFQEEAGILDPEVYPIGVAEVMEWVFNSLRDDIAYARDNRRLHMEPLAFIRKLINRWIGH